MDGFPFSPAMTFAESGPGVDKDFLNSLDVRLQIMLIDLDSERPRAAIQLDAKELCDEVTHSSRDDRRIELEENKLLLPDWESVWQQLKSVYTILIACMSAKLLDGDTGDYLYKALVQIVRFVVDGTTDHLRSRIGVDLRNALADYLSLRGFDVSRSDPTDKTASSVATESRTDDQAAIRVLSVYTDGLSDERIPKATKILDNDSLTADKKLWEIDSLMPIPPTASAEKLGKLLGVTKAAIQKTTWYLQKRKGEKSAEIGRRREQHRKRGQEYESDRMRDNND